MPPGITDQDGDRQGDGRSDRDLETLLREADVISLNCSMSTENEKLINAAAFARMSRRPIFINCARSELVDEAALIDALDSGKVAGAGIDVLSGEPPDLASWALAGRDNVIITPHILFRDFVAREPRGFCKQRSPFSRRQA